jgi:signal transduction histidine kinase
VHDLSLYLLDIIENSVRAGATVIATSITASRADDTLTITVEDDGPGLPIAPEQVMDPFFTTKAGKKTGLGLSLFRQAAEAAGGELTLGESAELGGVAVEDRVPGRPPRR